MVTSSVVMWEVASSGGSGDGLTSTEHDSGSSGPLTETSYTIQGLQSNTSYYITITAVNAFGNASNQLTLTTGAEGISYRFSTSCHQISNLLCSYFY